MLYWQIQLDESIVSRRNVPAFLIFFPITTFMARLGAKASHRINKKKMTKYFGLFLIIIGTKFLYEYLNI